MFIIFLSVEEAVALQFIHCNIWLRGGGGGKKVRGQLASRMSICFLGRVRMKSLVGVVAEMTRRYRFFITMSYRKKYQMGLEK